MQGAEQLEPELLDDFEKLVNNTTRENVQKVLLRYKVKLVAYGAVYDESLQALSEEELTEEPLNLLPGEAKALKVAFPDPASGGGPGGSGGGSGCGSGSAGIVQAVKPAGYETASDEAFLNALNSKGISVLLSEEQKVAWALKAWCSPRSPCVLEVLVSTCQQHLQPGINNAASLRAGTISPTGNIYSLGAVFQVVEREQATISMLLGIQEICKRREETGNPFTDLVQSDTSKELSSFLALLSIPGGGKTTAAMCLLHMAMAAEPEQLPKGLRDTLRGLDGELRQALAISCECSMLYRYDFSLFGNGLDVDQRFGLEPPVSLALRMLYLLFRGHVPGGRPAQEGASFEDFITRASKMPYAPLLLKFLTPSAVEAMAQAIWKLQEDKRHQGLLIFFLDEAHIVFEDTKEAQQQPGSRAEDFCSMLSAYGAALNNPKPAQPPPVLIVAGTHLDVTLAGRLQSASGQARPAVVPLGLLTVNGCQAVMQDLAMRLGAVPNEAAVDFWRILAQYSGGCPRILECLLAAAAHAWGRHKPGAGGRQGDELGQEAGQQVASQAPATGPMGADTTASQEEPTRRAHVPAQQLLQVLQHGGDFTPQMLEDTCTMAVNLLLRRSKTLEEYIDNAAHLAIGKAVIAKQLAHEPVTRAMPVCTEKPEITWGFLESVGLVAMDPVNPKKRFRGAESQACLPRMPYLLYAHWTKQLQATGVLINVGCNILHGDHGVMLQSRSKEVNDLGQLLARLFLRSMWQQQATMPLHELLPVPAGTPVFTYCSTCVIKVPTDFTMKPTHAQTSSADLLDVLRNKPQHRAFVGPGSASEPDWWLILDVDCLASGEAWKRTQTLVIQGQSKLRQQPASSPVPWPAVEAEYNKCFKGLGTLQARSLFVLVTDQEVDQKVTDKQDVLLVGKQQHTAFYGAGGSLKRKIIEDVWNLEVTASHA